MGSGVATRRRGAAGEISRSAAPRRPETADESTSTRDRILDAALETFSEFGFDGTTTRAIAARAGVNLGLLPYYFEGKEGLWREAVDRAFAGLRSGLEEVLPEPPPADVRQRMARLIRAYVRYVARHPEFVRLMHEEGKREGPRMRWLVDRHVRPLFENTRRLVEAARPLGRIPADIDPLHIVYILVGAVGVFFHQAPECRRLTGRDPMEPELVEAHADALVHLLVGEIKEESCS